MASRITRDEKSATGRREATLDHRLRFAIANKRLIQFTYHGKLRVAEPHDYGIQKGTTRLLVYQRRAAGSPPGKSVRGWRLLEVEQIAGCEVLDELFAGSRGDSHQDHYGWDVLFARVG
jgi:hypothetical protein